PAGVDRAVDTSPRSRLLFLAVGTQGDAHVLDCARIASCLDDLAAMNGWVASTPVSRTATIQPVPSNPPVHAGWAWASGTLCASAGALRPSSTIFSTYKDSAASSARAAGPISRVSNGTVRCR